MQIIGTWTSPYTRKVRIAALERQIDCDFVVDAPLLPETKVPSFNPLGKVPVLVLEDGSTLVDSPLICAHLDQVPARGPRLIPDEAAQRAAVLQWQAIADGMTEAAVLIRMEVLRPEALRSSAWIERQQDKIRRGLAWMEERRAARAFCVGNAFTVADIATGCLLGYLRFRFAELDWKVPMPSLEAAGQMLEDRESFKVTRFKA
jgi:glutathione S-transferase